VLSMVTLSTGIRFCLAITVKTRGAIDSTVGT